MGSYGNAMRTGFICRLCSKQKRTVIHAYSSKGQNLRLTSKIKFLPIILEKYDNLPKTICDKCIENLNSQYNLMRKARQSDVAYRSHKLFHGNGNCPVECPLHGVEE